MPIINSTMRAIHAAQRRAITGRLAGLLFMVGAAISLPTNLLFSSPPVGAASRWINLLAFVSGVVCFLIPWRRVAARWFHLVPLVGTAEVALSVWGVGVHGGIYAWYYVLVAVYVAYVFERRIEIAAHMGFVALCFTLPVTYLADPNTAAIRALVAVPLLCTVAGMVAYLREGLETGRAQLAEQARTDPLTGAGNLRLRDERLAYELGRHRRTGRPLALLVLDLDRFKDVNDTHGHPEGDRLLCDVGRVLSTVVRAADTVARPGGDEFCVIAPETGAADAQRLAERIEVALAQLTAVDRPLSASVGLALFPRDGVHAEQLIGHADHDQRLVKQAGGAQRARSLYAV
jgi:diguanylate cyclase (GGDEF)-like protein